MVVNVTYNDPSLDFEINQTVGKSYSILERLKLRGIGSPRLVIKEASQEIAKLLNTGSGIPYCNVEFRPTGIIIRFRSRLETYAFVIPYHKLVLYKSPEELSFYSGNDFIKVRDLKNKYIDNKFIRRLVELKSQHSGDLPY
jgi:hypothetical protein